MACVSAVAGADEREKEAAVKERVGREKKRVTHFRGEREKEREEEREKDSSVPSCRTREF